MENLQTSNNSLHSEAKCSGMEHYGLITELKREDLKTYKPCHYLVMGTLILKDYKGKPQPMTFDYESGTFRWSYPDLDEWGEIYDKETAMKLISHHVLNSSDSIKLQLAPIHIPFLVSTGRDAEYQNPYLMEGASTELVKAMTVDYMRTDGYVDETFYMPKSLGGEFIGYGSLPVEEVEEEINEAPQQPALVDVSDLPFIKPEEVAEFPDLLRSDWEKFNWFRAMDRKLSNRNIEPETAVKPLVCTVKKGLSVSLPSLPDSLTYRPTSETILENNVSDAKP